MQGATSDEGNTGEVNYDEQSDTASDASDASDLEKSDGSISVAVEHDSAIIDVLVDVFDTSDVSFVPHNRQQRGGIQRSSSEPTRAPPQTDDNPSAQRGVRNLPARGAEFLRRALYLFTMLGATYGFTREPSTQSVVHARYFCVSYYYLFTIYFSFYYSFIYIKLK
jgi:hypothetical protein